MFLCNEKNTAFNIIFNFATINLLWLLLLYYTCTVHVSVLNYLNLANFHSLGAIFTLWQYTFFLIICD